MQKNNVFIVDNLYSCACNVSAILYVDSNNPEFRKSRVSR